MKKILELTFFRFEFKVIKWCGKVHQIITSHLKISKLGGDSERIQGNESFMKSKIKSNVSSLPLIDL